jgi:hypothetical protein
MDQLTTTTTVVHHVMSVLLIVLWCLYGVSLGVISRRLSDFYKIPVMFGIAGAVAVICATYYVLG